MTFNEIVNQIADDLNLTSEAAKTRIGRRVNDYHRRVTTALGMVVTRRDTKQADCGIGTSLLTFSPCEKVISVRDRSTNPYRVIRECTIEQLRMKQPYANSFPSWYAVVGQTSNTVTIEVDCVAQAVFTLYADVHENATTLSGTQTPIFSESFHDILYHGPLADEYRKMGKQTEWKTARMDYETRVAELRFWFAKSTYKDIVQGATREQTLSGPSVGAGGGSSSSVNGATSYTQTGLITFDRTGQPALSRYPFAVAAGSDPVNNLGVYDAFISFSDVTTGNVTSAKHGFAPKTPGDGTKFLNGATTAAWAAVKDSDLSLSDITTNNVSAAGHGFAPKHPNDTTKFLCGDGSWVQPFDKVIADTSTGNQNNWAPGISGHSYISWNGASDTTITGMASGVAGQRVLIKNKTTTKVMYFVHQSGSSSAGNKFFNIITNTTPGTPVAPQGYALFEYDGTDWRLVGHDQGAWIEYASTITGYSGTPTQHISYRLVGSTLFVTFDITGTSNATGLTFTLPFTVALNSTTECSGAMGYAVDNGAALGADVGVFVLTVATVSCFLTHARGNWTNANTKAVRGNFNYQPV